MRTGYLWVKQDTLTVAVGCIAMTKYTSVEGNKTVSEHKTAISEVRQMMLVHPEKLLPQHCDLLEQDFQALGEGSTVDRQIWLAQMKSALGPWCGRGFGQ